MTETKRSHEFDLDKRTLKFARNVIKFTDALQKTLVNIEIIKQLVRSSGSVGANYIEANEALSKKDFIMRIKISRKEAKESRYWLNLIQISEECTPKRDSLIQESTELIKIFSCIIDKCA
jgi:four helix bundle protein